MAKHYSEPIGWFPARGGCSTRVTRCRDETRIFRLDFCCTCCCRRLNLKKSTRLSSRQYLIRLVFQPTWSAYSGRRISARKKSELLLERKEQVNDTTTHK